MNVMQQSTAHNQDNEDCLGQPRIYILFEFYLFLMEFRIVNAAINCTQSRHRGLLGATSDLYFI